MTERPYWVAAGTAGWGAILLWKSTDLPQLDRYAYVGPGMMVTVVGFGLLLLGLILAIQIWQGVPFEEQEAEDVAEGHVVSYTALAFAAAACALPLLTLPRLGFVLTGTGCFVLVARAFRSERWLANALIGAIFSLFCWYLFRQLGVQLGGLLPLLGV